MSMYCCLSKYHKLTHTQCLETTHICHLTVPQLEVQRGLPVAAVKVSEVCIPPRSEGSSGPFPLGGRCIPGSWPFLRLQGQQLAAWSFSRCRLSVLPANAPPRRAHLPSPENLPVSYLIPFATLVHTCAVVCAQAPGEDMDILGACHGALGCFSSPRPCGLSFPPFLQSPLLKVTVTSPRSGQGSTPGPHLSLPVGSI